VQKSVPFSPKPGHALCGFVRLLQITEPYLQIYRGILPPLFGQLDFTPLFGFLILQVAYWLVVLLLDILEQGVYVG
jgi:uncharacterized protein YggT (Ycf19 family)